MMWTQIQPLSSENNLSKQAHQTMNITSQTNPSNVKGGNEIHAYLVKQVTW